MQYKEFLREKVGDKKKQEAYDAALKEHKAKMREYMKNFRLRRKNLLKVCKLSSCRGRG